MLSLESSLNRTIRDPRKRLPIRLDLALASIAGYTVGRVAPIAQLVEQLLRKQWVGGSSPSWGATLSSQKIR